jgi:hypothetical protein
MGKSDHGEALIMKIERLEDVKSLPPFRELTPEELKEAYALARAAFTAEDLQGFTELDDGVCYEAFLDELEELGKQVNQGKQ